METIPSLYLVISIGIMHELWEFVRSKEVIVRGGPVKFVVELDRGMEHG